MKALLNANTIRKKDLREWNLREENDEKDVVITSSGFRLFFVSKDFCI